MSDLLIDSDILIDNLRGYEPARAYLKPFETGSKTGSISILTVTELASGQMTGIDEEARVRRLLSVFEVIDFDFEIAWHAGEIRRKYRTRIADAVIAATAIDSNLKLVTRNLSHFEPIQELNVEAPYE
jgi:predicted nucleic acid-binding protein